VKFFKVQTLSSLYYYISVHIVNGRILRISVIFFRRTCVHRAESFDNLLCKHDGYHRSHCTYIVALGFVVEALVVHEE